jgi:hypothetical protein
MDVANRGHLVRSLAVVLPLLATSGCNLALGIDDHEAIPANCGVDAVETAVTGFADVRSGHCYSVATNPSFDEEQCQMGNLECPNHEFAANECSRAGGYLECIGDEEEIGIINQNVLRGSACASTRTVTSRDVTTVKSSTLGCRFGAMACPAGKDAAQ